MNGKRLGIESLERRELLAADDFYVSPTGSDNNDGSLSSPWRTLQMAADEVDAGDRVTIRPGTYAGFYLTADGTAAAPIVFSAEPGVTVNDENGVTPDGINLEGASYVVIEGFRVVGVERAGIRSVLNHHVTIRNNKTDLNGRWGIFTAFSDDLLIENNETSRSQDEHGIYVSNSGDRPTVRGNHIWGNFAAGIHLNGDLSQGDDGIISGALIENNIIHDNGVGGGSGINGDGLQTSVIRNNLLYANHASGISLYRIDGGGAAKNNLVVNNTIVMASDARWALNIKNGSTGNQVKNNILYNLRSDRGSIEIDASSLPGLTSDYNIVMNRFTPDDGDTFWNLAAWRANTGHDLHSQTATLGSLFINAPAGDYQLSLGSPAIDAGTSVSVTTDLAGAARPQGANWDIGAYESGASDSAPPEVLSLRVRGSAWQAALAWQEIPLVGIPPTLPWVNLDTVEVAFSEAVVAAEDNLDCNGDGIAETVAAFDYDAATFTARWRLAAPLATPCDLELLGPVTDLAGNPTAFAGAPIPIVPADASGDGLATAADIRTIRGGAFASFGQPRYQIRNDLDGNGYVNVIDLALARDYGDSAVASARGFRARRREGDLGAGR